MSTLIDTNGYRSIKEVLPLVQAACSLQINGNRDVAIPYLQGLPGLGKTAMVYDLVENKMNSNLLHCHFALLPLEDLSGIPQFKKIDPDTSKMFGMSEDVVGTVWSLPALLTQILDLSKNGKPTVIFLDDFHLCSPAHLELMFELFTEWSLRGFKLPDHTAFILAGNDSAKSGAKVQNSAICNRVTRYPVKIDFDAWREFAVKNGVNRKITAFLSKDTYRKHIQEPEIVNEQFGSARSWTRLSYILNPLEEFMSGELSTSDLLYVSRGHVGPDASSKFASFYKLFNAVNAKELFEGGKVEVPREMDKLYIFMMAVCSEFTDCFVAQYVTKDKKFPVDEYYRVMGKILISIGRNNKDMALVGIKELLINADIHSKGTTVAQKIKSMMVIQDAAITQEIYDVIGELASY